MKFFDKKGKFGSMLPLDPRLNVHKSPPFNVHHHHINTILPKHKCTTYHDTTHKDTTPIHTALHRPINEKDLLLYPDSFDSTSNTVNRGVIIFIFLNRQRSTRRYAASLFPSICASLITIRTFKNSGQCSPN